MNIQRCIIIYLLVFTSCISFAQDFNVKGKVYDENNDVIIGAYIKIIESNQLIVTNDKGSFKVKLPANQDLTFITSHASSVSDTSIYRFKEGKSYSLKIILKTIELSGDVVIEGDRNPFIEKIENRPILIPSASGGDFNDVLAHQLGVVKNNELSSNYSVRGGNYDENLVYVNGVQIYRPFLGRSGQQEGLSFVNPDMVENVYFSAGGFDATYGDKLSSVLDVKYKKPESFGGAVTLSLLGASLNLRDVTKDERFSYNVGFRYRQNSNVLSTLDEQGEYDPSFIDVQSIFSYRLSKNADINFLGNYSKNTYRFIPQSRETRFGTFDNSKIFKVFYEGQEVDFFEAFTGALYSNVLLNKAHLNFTASVFQTYETETYDILGEYFLSDVDTDAGSESFGEGVNQRGIGSYLNHARNYLEANVVNLSHQGWVLKESEKSNFDLITKHDWGLRIKREAIDDEINEWEMVDSAGYNMPKTPDSVGYVNPNIQPNYDLTINNSLKSTNNVVSYKTSAYYQFSIQWNKNHPDKNFKSNKQLNIGARVLNWTYNNQTVFSPRAKFIFAPNIIKKINDSVSIRRNVKFSVATGVYQQMPFYREFRMPNGQLNPNIKAQTSYHFVLGSTYDFKWNNRPFKFITEAYYKYVDNEIPYSIDNVKIRYSGRNNAIAHIGGIDAKLHGELLKGVESWISLSFLTAQEDILDDYYYDYYNQNGENISDSDDKTVVDSSIVYPGFIPKPTDQKFKVAIYFKDEMPNFERLKVHLNLLVITGFPFGPDGGERYQDVFRSTAYRRLDLGFSFDMLPSSKIKRSSGVWKTFNKLEASLEVFNILNISNVASYNWVTDVGGTQYAIPNYLTNRLINLKIYASF